MYNLPNFVRGHRDCDWDGRWIYNYLCNQCLSPLKLWVWILFRQGAHDTTLCDKVCQWLATGRWFPQGTQVSSSHETDSHDVTEILLKVVLNTINTINQTKFCHDIRPNYMQSKLALFSIMPQIRKEGEIKDPILIACE